MITFDGPLVLKQLAEAKKKGDTKRVENLEHVLANLMSSPSSDSGLDPEEEEWLGYTEGNLEKRVSRIEARLGAKVSEVEAGSQP